ncbi:MAG: hypothetical protein ACLGIC_10445 [Acidimicrobiia bacterium]
MAPWDLSVDFRREDADGLTHAHIDDLAEEREVRSGEYLLVGDDNADPAVAQVVSVDGSGTVLLRVLPGHADVHRDILGGERA